MRKIFLLLLFPTSFYSQVYLSRQDNSAITQNEINNAGYFLNEAYKAYNEDHDLDKTMYYLKESEKKGWVSADFYKLIGQVCYERKKYEAARRYWMRGFKKHGCWECREFKNKMESTPKDLR